MLILKRMFGLLRIETCVQSVGDPVQTYVLVELHAIAAGAAGGAGMTSGLVRLNARSYIRQLECSLFAKYQFIMTDEAGGGTGVCFAIFVVLLERR
jgi:hypothetical protein